MFRSFLCMFDGDLGLGWEFGHRYPRVNRLLSYQNERFNRDIWVSSLNLNPA
jgi:hypothetical protein